MEIIIIIIYLMLSIYPSFKQGCKELLDDIKEVIILLCRGIAAIIRGIRWIISTLRNQKKDVGNY